MYFGCYQRRLQTIYIDLLIVEGFFKNSMLASSFNGNHEVSNHIVGDKAEAVGMIHLEFPIRLQLQNRLMGRSVACNHPQILLCICASE